MSKQSILYIGIALFITVILGGVIYFLSSNTGNTLTRLTQDTTGTLDKKEEETMNTVEDFTELKVTTVQEGDGVESLNGNTLVVNYEGTLIDGTKFDSSYDRGTPFEFVLGVGGVITGWDEGLLGMKVGEIRELEIPSNKGYGSSGAGNVIPPLAGLKFKVELLEIK
jgi:FKBP-type peptidyl-prolyl cis-trans isomerase